MHWSRKFWYLYIIIFFVYLNIYIGSAFLVVHKTEEKKYIAKKVMLSGLKQKEKEAAMLEVNLLKNLDHPHIVAYK
jgi:hypothetical protein